MYAALSWRTRIIYAAMSLIRLHDDTTHVRLPKSIWSTWPVQQSIVNTSVYQTQR
jgi:hypothetical protein